MLTLPQLIIFLTASLMILIIPGPAVVYGTLQSIQYGRVAGAAAVLGLELGTVVHVLVTALGIPALSGSATAFQLLKLLGIIYLVYLGISRLWSRPSKEDWTGTQSSHLKQIFWQGFTVELFNPQTVLFFFSFLPQFVTPAKGNVMLQVLTLGLLFVGLAIVVDLLCVAAAGSARHWLKNSQWLSKKQRYVESSVYFGLGIATALSR